MRPTSADLLARLLSGERLARTSEWLSAIASFNYKEIGDIGELYTAEMLRRRGLDVRQIGGNNEGYDIEVCGYRGTNLSKPLLIETKVCRDRKCLRDTWGSWHGPTRDHPPRFDFIVMINLNVGLRTHVVPVENARRWVYPHRDGERFSFRLGVTDDRDRREVGLLPDGARFNGAWHLILQHATRLAAAS